MKRFFRSIDRNDVLFFLGLGLIAWGLSGISLHMAAGAVGVILMIVGLAGAVIKTRRP
ncbi:MAG TPA: hypothetical protein VI776_05265 [Anaerolineales bacterium]|nr:hypothetical protein [Anaerolineales bacterium]